MVVACAMVMAVMTITLYRQDIEQHRDLLQVSARSNARLIEAVARFDRRTAEQGQIGDPRGATLRQIEEAHREFVGFGSTGEFTLAQRVGDQIDFVLRHRHGKVDQPQPVPFDSELAEPMRRALNGQSGTCIALDYHGATVLAAYEPVADLELGIVAKIDLTEIRKPFIRAGLLGGAVSLLIILLGAMLFIRISFPVIERLEAHARDLELEVQGRERAEEERARTQTQLIQAQKMESVGRLAGGVAHDFNNMLGVILGYTELALDEVRDNPSTEAKLREIKKAAERSSDLTHQLLAFARRQSVSPKVVDLNATVADTLRILERLIGEDIDLVWLPEAELWTIMIDPGQIAQVLANLCVNARDSITGVGKVTIETARTTLNEEYCAAHPDSAPGDYVMLAVSDSGCGMDEELQQLVFEPFFTTKDVGEGTGLGLATTHGIVMQNGGFVSVESEVGSGSTFRVYFRRHVDGLVDESGAESIVAPGRGHETVLLVEDEETVLVLGRKMLEKIGYHVLSTDSPREALRMASEHAGGIEVLLTDLVMPGMSGRDLSKEVRALRPGIRTVFMSGYTDNEIARESIVDHEASFIQKPFSMKDLSLKIREALERSAC